MPLAALDISPTAVTALSTLAGVVIGAIVGGLVSYRLERRRETAQARAGARLVRVDLAIAADQLERGIAEAAWWPFYAIALDSWERYRDVLAVAMKPDDWGLLAQSAIELRRHDDGLRTSPMAGKVREVGLAAMRGNAIRAYNALSKLADDPEQLEPSEPPSFGSRAEPIEGLPDHEPSTSN